MGVLLKSALHYVSHYYAVPVFVDMFKRPLYPRKWGEFFGADVSPEEVVKWYRRAGSPAGVALIQGQRSRLVFVDVDVYRVPGWRLDPARVASELRGEMVVAATARGGLRIVFRAREGDELPYRLVIRRMGDDVGEGGALIRHMWHMPPSVACIDEECRSKGEYYFVLPGGARTKYVWKAYPEPPEYSVEEALDAIELALGVEILRIGPGSARPVGELRLAESAGAPLPPCWRDLEDFKSWLEEPVHDVPLPACVARALGIRYREDGSWERVEEPVRHGKRFVYGAAAVTFLAACIADYDPGELVDFVGQNLEDYPVDEGEDLRTKLGRLIARTPYGYGPRYEGVGFVISGIDPQDCARCPYRDMCLSERAGRHIYSYLLYFYGTGAFLRLL